MKSRENFIIDTIAEILVIVLFGINIKFGAGSGAALMADAVTVFLLISFFSSRIHLHHVKHG